MNDTEKMRRANTDNKNNNRNRNRIRRSPFLPPSIGDEAMASKWDLLQTPIIIESISWLDQDSLMNLSLVSKQLHDIIATTNDKPGNKNKIHPIFEVSGDSTLKFYQNLQHHFLNKETKNKLQRYQIMRFKDSSKLKGDQKSYCKLHEMVKNIQMNGITSLYLSSSSSRDMTTNEGCLLRTLPNILPKLQELDFSNICYIPMILEHFSKRCPLLEKVTSNNWNHYRVCGIEMQASKNLKEININNSKFIVYNREISDLNNYPDVFMFHNCCKALERVSIRNMNWKFYLGDDGDDYDEDQKLVFTQNALIKFVRNAPPTLHWFRSDLTPDNMTMLRMERPGIELLN